MATAIPSAPLTSKFGKREGNTTGCLRVAHGGRRVAIDAAEVALTIDEGVPHREVLGQAHHGFVDGAVAVRVVLPHHVTDDRGALAVGRRGPHAHLVSGVEDAPLDRLQAIAHVRKSALDDDRHRVVEVRRAHLFFDAAVTDIADPGVLGHITNRAA
jgi:hypothetical protein